MKREESLLISAYTGYMLCPQFSELHKYIEEVMGEPIFTHQLGSEEFNKVLRGKLQPRILELIKGIRK